MRACGSVSGSADGALAANAWRPLYRTPPRLGSIRQCSLTVRAHCRAVRGWLSAPRAPIQLRQVAGGTLCFGANTKVVSHLSGFVSEWLRGESWWRHSCLERRSAKARPGSSTASPRRRERFARGVGRGDKVRQRTRNCTEHVRGARCVWSDAEMLSRHCLCDLHTSAAARRCLDDIRGSPARRSSRILQVRATRTMCLAVQKASLASM